MAKHTPLEWNEITIYCVEVAAGKRPRQPVPELVTPEALDALLEWLRNKQKQPITPAPEDLIRQYEENFKDPERDGLEEFGDQVIDQGGRESAWLPPT